LGVRHDIVQGLTRNAFEPVSDVMPDP
jgi:hypothetical protein